MYVAKMSTTDKLYASHPKHSPCDVAQHGNDTYITSQAHRLISNRDAKPCLHFCHTNRRYYHYPRCIRKFNARCYSKIAADFGPTRNHGMHVV